MPYKNPEDFREWKKRNPETREARAAQNRRSYLRNAGWTLETFTAASVSQAGLCAICGLTTDPKNPLVGHGGLMPDHRHVVPPAPRALLCSRCNTAIGLLRENPEICRAAAEYLETWSGV